VYTTDTSQSDFSVSLSIAAAGAAVMLRCCQVKILLLCGRRLLLPTTHCNNNNNNNNNNQCSIYNNYNDFIASVKAERLKMHVR